MKKKMDISIVPSRSFGKQRVGVRDIYITCVLCLVNKVMTKPEILG